MRKKYKNFSVVKSVLSGALLIMLRANFIICAAAWENIPYSDSDQSEHPHSLISSYHLKESWLSTVYPVSVLKLHGWEGWSESSVRGMSKYVVSVCCIFVMWMGTLGRFTTIFLQGRQILWLPVCFPAYEILSEKESTLKGKNLLPLGANSFLSK